MHQKGFLAAAVAAVGHVAASSTTRLIQPVAPVAWVAAGPQAATATAVAVVAGATSG